MPPTPHPTNNKKTTDKSSSPFRFSKPPASLPRSAAQRHKEPSSALPLDGAEPATTDQFARAPKFASRPNQRFQHSLTPRRSTENVGRSLVGDAYPLPSHRNAGEVPEVVRQVQEAPVAICGHDRIVEHPQEGQDIDGDEDMLDYVTQDTFDYPTLPLPRIGNESFAAISPVQQRTRSPSPKRPRLMAPPPPPPPPAAYPHTTDASPDQPTRQTPDFAPTPRFALPFSTQASTQPQTPTSLRHRTLPAFLPPPPFTSPHDIDNSRDIYLLPDAFSPHRRKERFLHGGSASLVRGWLVEASITASASAITISVATNPGAGMQVSSALQLTFAPDAGLVVRIERMISFPSAPSNRDNGGDGDGEIHLLLASVPSPAVSTAKDARAAFHLVLTGGPSTSSRIVSGIGAPVPLAGAGETAVEDNAGLKQGTYVRLKAPVWKMPLGGRDAGSPGRPQHAEGGGPTVEWIVCARWNLL